MRMLLVDDEAEVTRALLEIYDWNRLGITAQTCNSGMEALEKLKQNRFDILISDIKMPDISGLELSQNARQLYPDIKIILLSGYEKFEYAQKAMTIGVMEYHLKPVLFDDIIAAVQRAVKKIKSEEVKRNIEIQYRQNVEKYITTSKTLFLMNLLSGVPVQQAELTENLELFGIRAFKNSCCATCIDFLEDDLKNSDIWNLDTDLDKLRFAVHNVMNEVLAGTGVAFADNSGRIVVLLFDCVRESTAFEKIKACVDLVEELLFVRLLGVLGKIVAGPQQIADSYADAQAGYLARAFYLEQGVFWNRERAEMLDIPEDALMSCIDWNSKGGADHIISDWFDRLKKGLPVSPILLKSTWSTVLTLALKKLEALLENQAPLKNYKKTAGNIELMDFLNIAEFEAYIQEQFHQFQEMLQTQKITKNELVVIQTIQYIKENLDKELSLSLLAKRVFLSPGYLAVLIKEHTGKSYSEFILSLRIEQAKHLLANTSMSIGEISARIGYENQRYFSRFFKQCEGVKPSEYRKMFK